MVGGRVVAGRVVGADVAIGAVAPVDPAPGDPAPDGAAPAPGVDPAPAARTGSGEAPVRTVGATGDVAVTVAPGDPAGAEVVDALVDDGPGSPAGAATATTWCTCSTTTTVEGVVAPVAGASVSIRRTSDRRASEVCAAEAKDAMSPRVAPPLSPATTTRPAAAA